MYSNQLSFRFLRETASVPAEVVSVSANGVSYSILPDLVLQVFTDFYATLSQSQVSRFNGRLERGRDLALAGAVAFTAEPGVFKVSSASGRGSYTVSLPGKSCTCPDTRNGHICKHRIAAYLIQQALQESEQGAGFMVAAVPQENSVSAIAKSRLGDEAIVWGIYDDIPVEIVHTTFDGQLAHVRALPQIVNGELYPVFPFPSPFEGSGVEWSSATVPTGLIVDIRVFRKEVSVG